jgi:hypothetical protein
MNVIPTSEVDFHPHSFGDHQVRLFRWKGQVYRGIGSDYAPFFRQLFEDNIIQKMVEKGLLVESELQTSTINGYEMVVRHRNIAFASYPNEWCGAMLKDGALTIVDLALELARHGYTLGDAHPWNLLFDVERLKPIFVDLGSVAPITEFTWSLYDEFCRFCLYPLVLMSHGEDHLARLLMSEDNGVRESDIRKLKGISIPFLLTRYRSLLSRAERTFASRVPESYRAWLRQACSSVPGSALNNSEIVQTSSNASGGFRAKFHMRFLESVRRDVERIRVPSARKQYGDDSEEVEVSATPQKHWTATQCFLHKLLTELQPRTLLDVGRDTGWYAKLAALLGIQVVRWDTDPIRVTQFYQHATTSKLPMLPLVMDFSKPTPARGLANQWSIAAADRFRCDMVLALGMLHRVISERRLNFEQITIGLASLATRWVIVEFISADDDELRHWPALRSWYTLTNIVSTARKQFSNVQVILEGKTRTLLLCKK